MPDTDIFFDQNPDEVATPEQEQNFWLACRLTVAKISLIQAKKLIKRLIWASVALACLATMSMTFAFWLILKWVHQPTKTLFV